MSTSDEPTTKASMVPREWLPGCHGPAVTRRWIRFDRAVIDGISVDDILPEDILIPSLMPIDSLDALGYTSFFAGHLTFAAPVARPDARAGLVPAACLSFYPDGGGYAGNRILTDVVNVYRFEDGQLHPPERSWEFRVREFIVIGDETFVHESLDVIARSIKNALDEFEFQSAIKPATDYFTLVGREAALLRALQLADDSKQEIVVDTGSVDVTLASINYHGTHFSKHFGWDDDDSRFTGCVGIGVSRFLALMGEID